MWVSTGSASLGAGGGGGASTSGGRRGHRMRADQRATGSALQRAARATSTHCDRPMRAAFCYRFAAHAIDSRGVSADWAVRSLAEPPRGKMPRQQPRHPGHRGARALRIAPGAILCFDFATHRLPLGVAHPRADAAVGDDLHRAVGPQHVDQHAVVVVRVPDAQMREHLQRARARGVTFMPQRRRMATRSRPTKRISPGMLRFGRADRRSICGQYGRRENSMRVRAARGAQMPQRCVCSLCITSCPRRRRRQNRRRRR